MKRHFFPLLAIFLITLGSTIALYPTAASWVSQYNQSKVAEVYVENVNHVIPAAEQQLRDARRYNELLTSGAQLEANANIAQGTGIDTEIADLPKYRDLLKANQEGVMARLRIPAIDVDLPVYHGTDDDTLLKGAGHLQGTSLPVGGVGSRSVVTAHRGLAQATMFTNLNKVKKGDRFIYEVMGETLTYEVFDIQIIEPDKHETVRAVAGKDLSTLITCTPLGINSHRIVVTGERVYPTPVKDIEESGQPSEVPRFPWWLVIWGTLLAAFLGFLIYAVIDSRRTKYEPKHKKTKQVAKDTKS